MLTSLHIENYALIRHTDIHFGEQMVAITGETGAGKSIMLGALGLLLGQRADLGVLYDKSKKCIVEAQFEIGGLGLASFFADHDLDYDDTLILRREILPSAKSRAFVNDSPVSLPVLKELGPHIIDIHSQHETLHLADGDFQLSVLDDYHIDGASSPRAQYDAAYSLYVEHKHRLEQLTEQEAANRKEQDYLQFLFDELCEAQLKEGEQEQLEQESHMLTHAESIKQGLVDVLNMCNSEGEEGSLLGRLRSAKNQISKMSSYHPEVEGLAQRMDSSLIELDDIFDELEQLADRISFDPERQQQVDDRLDLIYRLEKKHNVDSIDRLLAIQTDLDTRLQHIAHIDEEITLAMEQVDRSFSEVQHFGDELSHYRQKAALEVQQLLQPTFAALGMKEAQLQIEVCPTADYHRSGRDKVDFLFNANRGGEFREIGKVASGGELSRLMLALKSLMAHQSMLPTIIFDEIDSGISGEVSARVSKIMQQMAQSLQVIVITHLPQMAAAATQHLKVYKQVEASATVSMIRQLDRNERIHEIAVMLSSEPPTQAALATAQELMGDE